MTSSGTRGPRPMPSTTGGGTWSYQPPKSSQVTKIAVEDHAGLFMIALTMEDTKFCAGCVGCGGGAEGGFSPRGAKLVFGGGGVCGAGGILEEAPVGGVWGAWVDWRGPPTRPPPENVHS